MKLISNARAVVMAALASAFAFLAAPAMATPGTGPDFSSLTTAINFTTAQDAVLSVGVLAIGLTLVVLGIRKIMAMVRGA